MADTPSIPPSSVTINSGTPSTTPVTPVSSPAPVQPVQPPQLTLSEVTVRQAPQALTQPQVPVTVEGRVVSSNPQTQEVRIQTTSGEVTVQSDARLPPDTKVTVEVYTERSQTRANIVVQRQMDLQTQQLEKIIEPPPTLQAGQKVTALLLSGSPPVQLEQLATAIETLKKTDPQKLLQKFSPELLQKLFTAPDLKNFLKELPQQPLKQLTEFVAVNNILPKQEQNTPAAMIKQFISAYLPQFLGGKTENPVAPENNAPDTLDNNMLQITRAQLHAKATQQTIQPPSSPASPPPSQNTGSGRNLFGMNLAVAEMVEKGISPQIVPDTSRAPAPLPRNMYQLNVVSIFPPNTLPEKITAALEKLAETPRQIPLQKAEVETTTSGGQPILKTPDSHFVIKTPASLPVGSTVIFEAAPMTQEQIIASQQQGTEKTPLLQNPASTEFDPLFSPAWPALRDALQDLQQNDPATAQMLRHTLPTPTPHLVPTALFFLAALRLGAVDNWLGDNTLKALRDAGKKDLIDRLGKDFGRISSQSKEPLSEEWRSISMPLLHDDQLSQMQFYVRQQYDQEQAGKDGENKPSTRFLLNLHLSRMGEIQLDGFIQKKHFDIILRTEESLPLNMRQELMKRFAQGLEQVQMQGGISFQTRQQGWVTVELPKQATYI